MHHPPLLPAPPKGAVGPPAAGAQRAGDGRCLGKEPHCPLLRLCPWAARARVPGGSRPPRLPGTAPAPAPLANPVPMTGVTSRTAPLTRQATEDPVYLEGLTPIYAIGLKALGVQGNGREFLRNQLGWSRRAFWAIIPPNGHLGWGRGGEREGGPRATATSPPRPLSRHLPRPWGLPPGQRTPGKRRRCRGKAAGRCRPRPGPGSRRRRPTGSCSTGRPLPGSTASSPGGESPRRPQARGWAGPSHGTQPGGRRLKLQVQAVTPGRSRAIRSPRPLSWQRSLETSGPTRSMPVFPLWVQSSSCG